MSRLMATDSPNPTTRESFLQSCQRLRPGCCEDWAAQLLYLCEGFWASLDDVASVSETDIDAFVAMLSEERTFRLAREVIPELRGEEAEGPGKHYRRSITHRLQRRIDENSTVQRPLSNGPLDGFFEEEKARFADSELYRAELLAYGTASISHHEKEAVRQWLQARPMKEIGKDLPEEPTLTAMAKD